jgi:DNA helicase TIP49 (TBP-interacting protein)
MLVDIARESHSLRYSLQLIALANSYAKKNGEYKVESGHISWVKERFVDTTTAFQEFENQNKRV